jgi:hypothetical protein
VVLGLSLIVIALQLFFAAFLLGVLEIPLKRHHAPGPTLFRGRQTGDGAEA